MVDIPIGQFNALVEIKDEMPLCWRYGELLKSHGTNPQKQNEQYVERWLFRAADGNDTCGCDPSAQGAVFNELMKVEIDVIAVDSYFNLQNGSADTLEEFDAYAREEAEMLRARSIRSENAIERERERVEDVAL